MKEDQWTALKAIGLLGAVGFTYLLLGLSAVALLYAIFF